MIFLEVGGLIFVGSLNLLLGLAVLSRDRTKKTNIMFLLLALSLAVWSFGIAAFLYTRELSEAAVYANIYYAAALGIAVAVAAFALYRTNEQPGLIWLTGLTTVFIGYCAVVSIYPDFILKEVVINEEGLKNVNFNVGGQVIYSLLFLSLFISAMVKLASNLPAETRSRRSQTKFIILGSVTAGIIGVIFNLVMPWFGRYSQIWVGPLSSITFTAFVVYAIAKHKLFDFRRTVARALAYVIALAALALIYSLVLFVLSGTLFNEQNISLSHRLFFIFYTLFSAVTFQPIKRFFDRITNKIFYRDAYDPEVFLKELNSELVTNIELEVLLRRTCTTIQETLKCEACFVITRKTDNMPPRVFSSNNKVVNNADLHFFGSELQRLGDRLIVADNVDESDTDLKAALATNNIAVIVPISSGSSVNHKRAMAYLGLGPKKSGNMYGKEDLRIIQIVSDELVIAIQNALRFEEIQGFAATLQAKVNEATAELKAANLKLKALDASKDEFISMASHQLRTPLTSVKGYLSMVLDGDAGKLTDMQQKLLSQAFTSSQRMVYLIADLLNVSRLRTGKFIVERKATNLAQVVEGEIGQLTEAARVRSLSLAYDKPAKFPDLMLDETKIRQVIMNFVDNAIYYTPKGGHITVKLEDKPNSIEFTVTDDGMGVPKAEQHELFNKFYRAGNARKARPDGTGLGLFMAKKVIIAQGGSLIFSSQEGRGSTFGFTFAKAKLLAPDLHNQNA